jgi:hypothetical protein
MTYSPITPLPAMLALAISAKSDLLLFFMSISLSRYGSHRAVSEYAFAFALILRTWSNRKLSLAAALQVFEEPTGCGDVVDWGLIDDLDEFEGIISCLSIIIVAVMTIPLPLLLRVSCGLVYECSLTDVSDQKAPAHESPRRNTRLCCRVINA